MAKAFFKDYNADLDTKLFAALFKIYNDNVNPDLYPEVIDLVNKKYKGNYDKFAAGLQREIHLHGRSCFQRISRQTRL
ncbi:MAG: hypothetical protein V8T44_15395 [Odoribacter splanchnicus]